MLLENIQSPIEIQNRLKQLIQDLSFSSKTTESNFLLFLFIGLACLLLATSFSVIHTPDLVITSYGITPIYLHKFFIKFLFKKTLSFPRLETKTGKQYFGAISLDMEKIQNKLKTISQKHQIDIQFHLCYSHLPWIKRLFFSSFQKYSAFLIRNLYMESHSTESTLILVLDLKTKQIQIVPLTSNPETLSRFTNTKKIHKLEQDLWNTSLQRALMQYLSI